MCDKRTLLSLFRVMFAHFDQALDHKIEGIDLIVVQRECPAMGRIVAFLHRVFYFGFTGYLLPWDDVSFFATKIGLDVAAKTPVLGGIIADLLRGGEAISQATISRFFVIHIS